MAVVYLQRRGKDSKLSREKRHSPKRLKLRVADPCGGSRKVSLEALGAYAPTTNNADKSTLPVVFTLGLYRLFAGVRLVYLTDCIQLLTQIDLILSAQLFEFGDLNLSSERRFRKELLSRLDERSFLSVLQATTSLVLISLDEVKVCLKGLSSVDLVAAFCVKNPISHKRFSLARVLWIVNPDMDILLRRLDRLRFIHRRFIDVSDFTEAPASDVGKILLRHLHSIHE